MIDVKLKNDYLKKEPSKRTKKKMSEIYSFLKHKNTPNITKCVICKKECSSFCNSHNIPRFVLKTISKTGRIMAGHNFMKSNFDKGYGINNALTFSCICNECDNTYFKEYEDPSVFRKPLTTISINEIAIKTYLRHYFKRMSEKAFYLSMKEEIEKRTINDPEVNFFLSNKFLTINLDIKEAEERISKYTKKKTDHFFYVIDEIDLDYTVGIAYQGFIALTKGFDGVVNDTFNYDEKYKIQLLYISIFPHESGTKILVFCEEGSNRLRHFYKYYKKQNLKTRLYVINYILLLYDEEWCVSSDFDSKKLNSETLKIINQTTDTMIQGDDIVEIALRTREIQNEQIDAAFEIKTSGNVYNFLEKH